MLQFKQGDTVLINNDVYIIANSDRFITSQTLFSILANKVENVRYCKIILIEKIHKQKMDRLYTEAVNVFGIKTNIGECFCIAANKLKI